MYDMYPEWGPARHYDDQNPSARQAAMTFQAGIDLRDSDGERPDDN